MADQPALSDIEITLWNCLNTELRQLVLCCLSDEERSLSEVHETAFAKTGYDVPDTVLHFVLRLFEEQGTAQSTATRQQERQWWLTETGNLILPSAYALQRYSVERETSIARYLDRTYPAATFGLLQQIAFEHPAAQTVQALLAQEPTQVQQHFQLLQNEGIVDLSQADSQTAPHLDWFVQGAASLLYHLRPSSGKSTYPIGLFEAEPELARHYHRQAVANYIFLGSRLENSLDFASWFGEQRKSRRIKRVSMVRDTGYVDSYLCRAEHHQQSVGTPFIVNVSDYFGADPRAMVWLCRPKGVLSPYDGDTTNSKTVSAIMAVSDYSRLA